jgi:CRISPR/Cas system-associated protein endoribonuclease Cas2
MQVMRMRSLAEVIKKSSAAFSISLYSYSRIYDFSKRINEFNRKLKKADPNSYEAKLLEISKKRFEDITHYQSDVREKVYLLCIHGISRNQIQDFFNKAQGSLVKAG